LKEGKTGLGVFGKEKVESRSPVAVFENVD